MFYKVEIKDHIRVPPMYLGGKVEEAVGKSIRQKYEGRIDPSMGIVIDVESVGEVGEGKVIHGDGAAYYETTFTVLVFRPDMQEVNIGIIRDITDFGAFLTMGPIEGMIHIGQTMDDFVSFSKEKVLTGRDSNRVLKVGDTCRARCVAVSFKDATHPKIGLTMRQQGLGKLEWLAEEPKKETKEKKK
jgi:DNA-directed RNA polymerase subunit E'